MKALLRQCVVLSTLTLGCFLVAAAPASPPCQGVVVGPDTEVQSVVALHPAGTTYCFGPGLYRLTQTIVPKSGDRLIGAPGAVLSGAKVITEWTQRSNLWVASGQTQRSPLSWKPHWPPIGNPAAQYNEDMFMDGRPLRRVLSLSEVGPGTFYFDYDAASISLGDDPTGHLVEGSAIQDAIRSGANHVAVQGLTIEKFTGLGIALGPDALIQDNEVRSVHLAGVHFSRGSQVLHNYLHHNGQYGMGGSGDNVLVEGNEIAFNDTADYRTVSGGCWAAGGTKWVFTDGLVVRNNYTHDNHCDGFWSDLNNINTVYENNRVVDNYRCGINIEISYATTIRHNLITGNLGCGIVLNSSRDQDVYDNTLRDNGVGTPPNGIVIPPAQRGAILIVQQRRGSGRYGKHFAQNISVHDNIIGMAAGVTGALGAAGLDSGQVSFAGNRYVVPDPAGAWWVWQRARRTWSEWQAIGQDATGSMARR